MKKSSSFFSAKVAFEIPEKFEVEGRLVREIPEALVTALMDLFPRDCEFEAANVCNPPLLVVNVHKVPSAEWFSETKARIDAVLAKVA